jgi:hypothetical protein
MTGSFAGHSICGGSVDMAVTSVATPPSKDERPANPSRGVYFIANDYVRELAIAFLKSFRRFNPSMPLCLIPYDDRASEVISLKDEYRFTVFEDSDALRVCGRVSRSFLPYDCGMFRKLAAWSGQFDEFIYFDADTLVLADVSTLFAHLARADFLVSDAFVPGNRKWVWKDSIYQANVLTKDQIEFAANMGFFISRRGLFSPEEMLAAADRSSPLGRHMELNCLDQPFLNYLILTSGARYSSLRQLRDEFDDRSIPIEVWAGLRKRPALREGRYFRGADPVFLVHWAGQWQLRPFERTFASLVSRLGLKSSVISRRMPLRDLWQEYRKMEL